MNKYMEFVGQMVRSISSAGSLADPLVLLLCGVSAWRLLRNKDICSGWLGSQAPCNGAHALCL
jgi:hypothetical protein